jgi:hypothetical protein
MIFLQFYPIDPICFAPEVDALFTNEYGAYTSVYDLIESA